MKYLFFISFLLFNSLYAKSNYELKLYETILPSIFTQAPINVYLDKEMRLLLKNSTKFKIVLKCTKEVTLLIGKNFNKLSDACQNKPIFSTSYKNFKNDTHSFGAFYWRKGRPQVKFKEKALERYNLTLPLGLQRYKQ